MVRELYNGGFFACHTRAKQIVGSADSTTTHSGRAAHTTAVEISELWDEEIDEISADPADEGLRGKVI